MNGEASAAGRGDQHHQPETGWSKRVKPFGWLPVGQSLALRIYNRALMHLAPRQLARTYFGSLMALDIRDFIQATIFHFGVWEPNISATLEGLIDDGDVVLDVGANVGYFSLLFSGRVGPSGRVIAIEAHPRFCDLIEDNLRVNGVTNVTVKNVAVSDERGEVRLYEGPLSNSGLTTLKPTRGFTKSSVVQSASIMDILADVDLSSVTLIKIDIEGSEGSVMRGILDNIRSFPDRLVVAVEINPHEETGWSVLFEKMLAAGFQAILLSNEYAWDKILVDRGSPGHPILEAPPGRSDVLFYRGIEMPTSS